MSNPERTISRRQFLKTVRDWAIGAVVFTGAGAGIYGCTQLDNRRRETQDEERKRTGGYTIRDIGPNLKQITLLPSGKTKQDAALFSGGSGGFKDIRTQTLGDALSKLSETCEVDVKATTIEESGWGSATSGLIVGVKSCK